MRSHYIDQKSEDSESDTDICPFTIQLCSLFPECNRPDSRFLEKTDDSCSLSLSVVSFKDVPNESASTRCVKQLYLPLGLQSETVVSSRNILARGIGGALDENLGAALLLPCRRQVKI